MALAAMATNNVRTNNVKHQKNNLIEIENNPIPSLKVL
jgi:hypothetical protein